MNPIQKSRRFARLAASGDVERVKRGDSGYAYIMALFMVLTVIIASQIVLRNMVTVSRSQREARMIWCGNQYVRAIKMYYRKTGHFPQSQDDLLTGVPEMHFLRSEAMKDPMNNKDGDWRFIYMNAAGAIIGSVKYGSLSQMALLDMNGGQMPGTQQSDGSSNVGSGATASGPLGQLMAAAALGPKPTGPVSGPVFGGQLIGVGSTVDKTSVRVYKGGTKYNEWEFIWNPLEEQARAMQQGLGGASAAPAAGGIPGLGLPIAPINGGSLGTGGASGTASPGGAANPTSSPNGNSNANPSGDANPPGDTNSSGATDAPTITR